MDAVQACEEPERAISEILWQCYNLLQVEVAPVVSAEGHEWGQLNAIEVHI